MKGFIKTVWWTGGVQKTFSDVFGCYSLQNHLWPEKPVGSTKLIGACYKQQREADLTVKYFHDLLDTICTTNTRNSMEAFSAFSQIISEDMFIVLQWNP